MKIGYCIKGEDYYGVKVEKKDGVLEPEMMLWSDEPTKAYSTDNLVYKVGEDTCGHREFAKVFHFIEDADKTLLKYRIREGHSGGDYFELFSVVEVEYDETIAHDFGDDDGVFVLGLNVIKKIPLLDTMKECWTKIIIKDINNLDDKLYYDVSCWSDYNGHILSMEERNKIVEDIINKAIKSVFYSLTNIE